MILVTIGRNKDNRYVIEDPQKRISGYHAEIKVRDDNSISLIDHSSNGTTVNGKRIDKEVEVQINRGTEITFGGFAKLDWNRVPVLPPVPPGTNLYSIGVNLTNRIVVNDSSNMVSRYHATLKISPKGKITINDHSSNGTFVNGSRIPSNQDIPVKRSDKILFANTQPLNWSKIPNSKTNPWLIISPIAAILVVGLILFNNWDSIRKTFSIDDSTEETKNKDDNKKDTIGSEKKDKVRKNINYQDYQKKNNQENTSDSRKDQIDDGRKMPETEIYAKYGKAVVCVLHKYRIIAELPNGRKLVFAIIEENDENKIYLIPEEDDNSTKGIKGCTGTAFFIDNKGTMMTNRHVAMPWELEIDNYKRIAASQKQLKDGIYDIYGESVGIGFVLNGNTINSYGDFTNCVILSQKSTNIEKDVAMLQTKDIRLPNSDICPIDINNAMIDQSKLAPGQKVYVIGFPLGLSPSALIGSKADNAIEVRSTNQGGTINTTPGTFVFGVNAQMTHGASGSPILNERGQLIGVFNSGFDKTQGLNAAVLAKHAKELYDQVN